jgi:hypothetical protein
MELSLRYRYALLRTPDSLEVTEGFIMFRIDISRVLMSSMKGIFSGLFFLSEITSNRKPKTAVARCKRTATAYVPSWHYLGGTEETTKNQM